MSNAIVFWVLWSVIFGWVFLPCFPDVVAVLGVNSMLALPAWMLHAVFVYSALSLPYLLARSGDL